jgi:hypothetical protein
VADGSMESLITSTQQATLEDAFRELTGSQSADPGVAQIMSPYDHEHSPGSDPAFPARRRVLPLPSMFRYRSPALLAADGSVRRSANAARC